MATENYVGFVREALERAGYTVTAAHFLVGGTAGPDEGFVVGQNYGYDECDYDRQAALTVTGGDLTGQNTVMFVGERSVDTAFIFGPDVDRLGAVVPAPDTWGEDEDDDDEDDDDDEGDTPLVEEHLDDHGITAEADRMRVLRQFVESLPKERALVVGDQYSTSPDLAELLDRCDLSEDFAVWLDERSVEGLD